MRERSDPGIRVVNVELGFIFFYFLIFLYFIFEFLFLYFELKQGSVM